MTDEEQIEQIREHQCTNSYLFSLWDIKAISVMVPYRYKKADLDIWYHGSHLSFDGVAE